MGRHHPQPHYHKHHIAYTVPGTGGAGGGLGAYDTALAALDHSLPAGWPHPTFIETVVQHAPLGKLVRTRTHRWHSRRGWVEMGGGR